MRFQRSASVPDFADYRQYRSYLRNDFGGHCAYCTSHESEIGGEDCFEIDHFRPKSKFPELVNDYKNLYYSCHGCNRVGAKGEVWPSDEMLKKGYHFFDPMIEDPYELHMRERPTGLLVYKTRVGEYSIKMLRLNRDGLVQLRKDRRRMRIMLRNELKKLLKEIDALKKARTVPRADQMNRLLHVRQVLQARPISRILPNWWNDNCF